MAQKLQLQLKEVGSKLENPPASKDALVKLLKFHLVMQQAAACLSELDQSPPPSLTESMQPCLNAFAKPELLKHQDRDVKVLVATCICEITRITAPEAPYSDDVLRDIFHLIVGIFKGLGDINAPSFGRRVVILETLARYKSCVVMLDLECDELVNELFSTFFNVASDDHPENVLMAMQTIMVLLLDESEDIPDNLLVTILSVLGRVKRDVSMAGRRLAKNVIQQCAGKLEPCIKQFLISSISGENISLNGLPDYHDVIYDLYECAPQILWGIVPYLTGELLTDELNVRLKAVKLLGELFALPGHEISEAFRPLFSEFLKRLTDRIVDVRISVIEHVRKCLLSNPSSTEASEIITALSDRLLDYDENVRKQVVAAIFDVACQTLKSIPAEVSRQVAERLRDKSLLVKKYTMDRLAELYQLYSSKYFDGSMSADEFDWMPGKILRCLYDKYFRYETIEVALCGSLPPNQFSVKDKVKHWITVFSVFEKVDVKALEKLLAQKQRLQQELQKYLSLRQANQDGGAPDLQKRILSCLHTMSHWFGDPAKAEKSFQILNQLKDANIWKILTSLLDSNTGFQQAYAYRDDLLKILGDKHPLYDFLETLSMKCSYLLFNKEFVKETLLEAAAQKSAGNSKLIVSCMNLLVVLASYCPFFLVGAEEDLVQLLKEDDETIKEGILHVLAKAGGIIREQLSTTSSSVDLLLETLCLEGTRKQAMYSVQALAAITKDDGLKSLSVLYKRLVDMLDKRSHLPAILQSLGCIAQTAMSVFETREDEIVQFITTKILQCSNESVDNSMTTWGEQSELCLLKIYGIKALVKSYLPMKDVHLRQGIDKLVGILKNILSFGEISKDIKSSDVDKAHLRLAAAKAILRLSKYWDQKIPVDVFHLTLRTSQDIFPQARKLFLGKVHQYIKERVLDAKFACTFVFNITGPHPTEFQEDKHNLTEVVQMCHQMKARQISFNCDVKSSLAYPECILAYLVHALAHHPTCPNVDTSKEVEAFEPIYRQLHLFLSALVHGYEEGKLGIPRKESLSAVVSIFQSIKRAEDIVDEMKSKNSHAICDLGLSITRCLANEHEEFTDYTPAFHLPPAIYKPFEKKEGDDSEISVEQSWLAGESVTTHFKSLKLEEKEVVGIDSVKGESDLGDDDIDGFEVPLGKMMKHLRSSGTNKKKGSKKSNLSKVKISPENDLDILGMVREINLDNLERADELARGQENAAGKKVTEKNVNETTPASKKRKKKKTTKGISILASNNTTLSTEDDGFTSLNTRKSAKGMIKASKTNSYNAETLSNSIEEDIGGSTGSDLLACCLPPVKAFSSKGKEKSRLQSSNDNAHLKAGAIEMKPLPSEDANKKFKSSVGSVKKRKRKTVAGLVKCSVENAGKQNAELIGSRIKVWWPMDKQFYEGVVQSYDSGKKKHVILYEDGDVEVLQLEKERWELVSTGYKPKKRLKLSDVSISKRLSVGKKKMVKKSNMPRKTNGSAKNRKATPKGRVESEPSGHDICTDNNEPESVGIPHVSSEQPLTSSEVVHANVEEKGSPSDAGEEPRDLPNSKESDKEENTDPSNSGSAKDSDDELLSLWKLRAAKVT